MAAKGEEQLRLDTERVEYWMSKGAQPSQRVSSFIQQVNRQAA